MRILYDGHIYSLQATGGISRYFANLISRLPADCDPSLVVGRPLRGKYPFHPNLKVYQYGSQRLEHLSYTLNLLYSTFRDSLLKNVLARKRFDVFHPTYYSLLAEQRTRRHLAPMVITVWDMIHELYSSEIDPTGENAELKRKAIQSAQKIICISQNTKEDLLERYALPDHRVAVTHLASEIDDSLSFGDEPVPGRPYYLYVGLRTSYKNFDGLLKALARAVPIEPNLALCVVGPQFTETENRYIADLRLAKHVEHYGNISDRHLAKLYRCSLALVYPSFYEGFGLPPLEAMSCGTVAVVSNAASLPEVVGDAGVLFDPKSTDELTEILLSLPNDENRRDKLILKGRERAREFNWCKTVAQTVDVYNSVFE